MRRQVARSNLSLLEQYINILRGAYAAIIYHRMPIAPCPHDAIYPEMKRWLREVYLYYFLYCSRREKLPTVNTRHLPAHCLRLRLRHRHAANRQ